MSSVPEIKKALLASGFEVYRTRGNEVHSADRVRDNLIMDSGVSVRVGAGLAPRALAGSARPVRCIVAVPWCVPQYTQTSVSTVCGRPARELTNRSTTEFKKMQQAELLAARMRDLVRERVRVGDDEAYGAF